MCVYYDIYIICVCVCVSFSLCELLPLQAKLGHTQTAQDLLGCTKKRESVA